MLRICIWANLPVIAHMGDEGSGAGTATNSSCALMYAVTAAIAAAIFFFVSIASPYGLNFPFLLSE